MNVEEIFAQADEYLRSIKQKPRHLHYIVYLLKDLNKQELRTLRKLIDKRLTMPDEHPHLEVLLNSIK